MFDITLQKSSAHPAKRGLTTRLHKFWLKNIQADDASSPLDLTDERTYRRISSAVLSIVIIALLLASGVLNIVLQNTLAGVLLLISTIIPIIALIWLVLDRNAVYGPPMLLLLLLVSLGTMLLFGIGTVSNSSFVWLVLFPPMLLYCIGVRYGAIIFAVFYALLALVLLGPLQVILPEEPQLGSCLRFLLAMLSSFTFACFSEVVRCKSKNKLASAVTSLKQEALTDQLTGLGNRRDFQKHFAWIQAKNNRVPTPFALAMLDVDHFKGVNDTYGHDVGDQVLVHVANVITEHMRASDKLFRWGGEEFIILMLDTWPEAARQAAERVRKCVADTPYIHEGAPISYSVSIGLYCCDSPPDINEALSEADRHLYVAKHSGRNRVVAEARP